jgi:hypothetical protein
MHLERIEALIDFGGVWGVLFLIVVALCTVAIAVWLWRKI